ncbi:MAG TPA: DUF5818 domain-containing protein [Terriglobales bacterium]|jgi:hypothetical protein
MKRMLRIFANFVLALGVALLISMPVCAQDTQSIDPSIPAPAIQDPAIHEIPPAMNLLSAIPISQAESEDSAGQPKPAAQSQQAANSALPKVETFTGTVAKGHDGYFLQGPDGSSYRLDDGNKAGPYDGRKVQIVGRLELDTNLIHIDRIQPTP